MDATNRLQALDILRGIALLGMFVVHFHMRSTDPGDVEDILRTLIWRLVESKAHGTFALLFGAGFAIQLRRAETSGRPFTSVYLRRLIALAGFGAVAHAGFGFNVLLGYAIWGVPLLAVRRWSTRALIAVAIGSAVSVPLYHLVYQQYLTVTGGPEAVRVTYEARAAEATAVNGARNTAERQGSYRALVGARLAHMAWFYRQPFFFMPGATFALFIAGMLLVRHGVFENPLAHPRALTVLSVFGLVSWLADDWLLDRWSLQPLAIILHDQWLTFTYVAVALWLFARWSALPARLLPVASAGRMALTNYLLQIAALDVLFSGYAVGFGRVRPSIGLTAAIACFAIEVLVSTLWLARFRLGPAEWLWRSLTYGRLQPMRSRTPPVEPAGTA